MEVLRSLEREGHLYVAESVDFGARRVSRKKGIKKTFKRRKQQEPGTKVEYLEIWQFTGSLSGWAGTHDPCREQVGTISRGIGGTHGAPYIPLHGPYLPFGISSNTNINLSSFVAKDCPTQAFFVSAGRRSLLGPLWVSAERTQNRAEMGEKI